ncbi:hypothetical protein M0R45_001239 [Rubus argutus]|uniref:Uncharacterized protein n=1 Tax=Rubus argutus TaxID=59490 RepID=A0AAW1VIF0_RUBAR
MPHQVSLTLVKVVFGLFVLITMANAVDARFYPHGNDWFHHHHHHHHDPGYYFPSGLASSASSSNTLTSSATLGSVAVLCFMTLQHLL